MGKFSESTISKDEQLKIWQSLSERGFSVIPVNGKNPFEKEWQRYCSQKRPFNPKDFKMNGKGGFLRNAAIATGTVSGIVFDIDDYDLFLPVAQKNKWTFPDTFKVKTGSGKAHYYFEYPSNGKEYGNKAKKTQGFDIKGLGGCVVAPGSVHPDTGGLYTIEKDLPLAPAPEWLLSLYNEPDPAIISRDETVIYNDTDIDCLPISEKHRTFFITGNPAAYPSRSEAFFAALCAMIRAGVSEGTIAHVVESCSGGAKFKEKGNSRFKWLQGEIARATIFINTDNPEGQIYAVAEKLKAGEVGLAQLLATICRNKLRYDIREGRWYLWGKHFWTRVSDERVMESFETLVSVLKQCVFEISEKRLEVIGKDDTKVKQLEVLDKVFLNGLKVIGDVSRRMKILKLCKSEGSYLGFDGAWDADPYLIPCINGVLNIDTLAFRPGDPKDNIRTALSIEWKPEAQCPTWKSALLAIFDGNIEMIDWLQRKLGYDTTGLNEHHIMTIWEGKGRNGKGVVYRSLQHTLSGFIAFVDRELLLERKYGRQSGAPSPDILSLEGKRIAICVETTEGRKFDAGKMKVLTGGDVLSARGMYAKDVTTFKSIAKLHLLTNFRPHISGGDYAAWQRIVLLPFPVSFVPEPSNVPAKMERLADPKIEEKIKQEAEGLLVWLVEGYRNYKRKGLILPACIKEATTEYRKEEDTVGRFFEEKIETFHGNLLPAGECYQAFKSWCEGQDITPKHIAPFGREIRNHVEAVKKNKNVFYKNVRLS